MALKKNKDQVLQAVELVQKWLALRAQGMSSNNAAKKIGTSRNTLESYRRRYLPDLTVTQEVLGKNNEVVRTIKGYRENNDVSTEGLMVTSVTKGPYGGAYVKYEKEEISHSDLEQLIKDIATEHSPSYKKIDRKQTTDGKLLIVDIADIHIGKYSSTDECSRGCNIPLAVSRAKEAFGSILLQATGHNIDQILLTVGNDIIHFDNDHGTTTSGTKQDTAGTLREAFKAAQKMYIEFLETLIPIAKVHVMHNTSNHDFFSGWALAQVLEAWFKDTDVTFDVSGQHRKYFKYGKSLIGSTHGDGAKEKDLLPLMTEDNPKISKHECPFRYVYCHHKHHKIAKDYINGTVEYVRSTSTDDAWHNRNGYLSMPAGEGFIHSKDRGQIARLTHYV